MSREKELVKNSIIISLGTFLPKFTTLVTLPILTAYLTKAEYGTIDLLSTLLALLFPIATLKIEAAAFRFLIDCRSSAEKAGQIISTILNFLVPVTLLVDCIVFWAIPVDSIVTKLLICVDFLFSIVLSCIQQIARGLSKNLVYSVSAIISSAVNMVLIVVLIANLQCGFNGFIIASLVSSLVSIIVLTVTTGIFKLYSIKIFCLPELKEMIAYSWPMIPNSLSLWVMNLSDRLIVTAVMGIEANAVYAVANKIPKLFASLQGTFVYAWQENASVASEDADAEDYYSRMFDWIYSLLVGMLAGLIAVTPVLFKILIRGEYHDAYYQMPFLFGGMLFSALSSFLGGIYVAYKKTGAVGATTIIAAAINFVINIVFIKFIGLYAASISTFVSFLFLAVYRMFDVQKFKRIKYRWGKIITTLAVLVLMCAMSFLNYMPVNVLNFFIGIIFAFILYRKLLMVIWSEFRKKMRRRS